MPLGEFDAPNLKRRVLTAAALVAAMLIALYAASDLVWALLMVGVVTAAAWEWAGLMRLAHLGRHLYSTLTAFACVAMLVMQWQDTVWTYLPAMLFWTLLAPYWLWRGWQVASRLAMAALGWLLLLPATLAMVRLHAEGPELLLAVLGVVVVADSAAYFIGRRYGRRRLAPRISPGKTWEGVLGAWVAVSLYALLLNGLWPASCGARCLPYVMAALWVMFMLSVVGDLFESWLKRQAGVKDSGSLLPGHGGVLDRIDSQIAVLPAAALGWMWLS